MSFLKNYSDLKKSPVNVYKSYSHPDINTKSTGIHLSNTGRQKPDTRKLKQIDSVRFEKTKCPIEIFLTPYNGEIPFKTNQKLLNPIDTSFKRKNISYKRKSFPLSQINAFD